MTATKTALPDDLFKDVQQIFRQTPALLIGSGFSCGYGLPGMGALGAHLEAKIGPQLVSPEAKALWDKSLAAIHANLEAGLNTIPQGVVGREEIVSAIRNQTAKLILESTEKAENQLLRQAPDTLAPVRLLRMLYNGAPQNAEHIPVITTNYDTLIELFCDLAELPLDTGFVGHRRRKPRPAPIFQTQYSRSWAAERRGGVQVEHRPCKTVRLHKPHGSISWLATEHGPVEVLNSAIDAARAIVVPGPSKYQDALVNVLFDLMRTEMNSAIGGAAALFCLGFGFNDDHLQGVIRGRLDAGMPMVLLTRGKTASIEGVLKTHPHVIGIFSHMAGSEVHWQGQTLLAAAPLWQLDDFLKTFLE
ncbi:SIR2 family protein [Hydrogenophaga sp.]|uniref:SIR2 family protein n=1 Tax=Hydrogenophaga sp. TaxID=1904254 RepID=UPI003F727ACF